MPDSRPIPSPGPVPGASSPGGPDGLAWVASEYERTILYDPARLAALEAGRLLWADDTDDFDRLTTQLARLLGAPMALFTVLDADRQFFLSHVGLPPDAARARQTDLGGSFCKHVVFDDAPFVVPDVAREPRVLGNTSIDVLGMGCYLGAPVTTSDGVRVGALCVIGREPRDWAQDDVRLVEAFAAIAATLVEARLAAAREVMERREKLDILARITEGFLAVDRAWHVTFANAEAGRVLQAEPERMRGRSLWDIAPALVDSEAGRWLREIAGAPGVEEREVPFGPPGAWFDLRAVSTVEGVSLYLRNISRRKRAELALAASADRYRELATLAPVGIFEADADGQCVLVNTRWSELSGLALHEAAGDGWLSALHPDDRAPVAAAWAEAVREARDFVMDYRYRHADGRVVWVSGRGTPLRGAAGECVGFLGTEADVTTLKRVEQELRQLNQQFELAFAGSDIGLWDWHVPSGRTVFNAQLPHMLGYTREEFGSDVVAWADRIHPEDHAAVTRDLQAHLDGQTPFYRSAHRLRTRRGDWRWILDSGAVVERDATGAPIRAVGTHVDIHESKVAEARFRLLFEKSGDPLLLLDASGVLDCNDAVVRALRCTGKAEVLDSAVERFFPPVQPGGEPSMALALQHLDAARAIGTHRFTWLLRRVDGTDLPLEISLARADHDGRQVFLMTWHDLTAQRDQERVLREARDAAEQANRTKSDFLARMSHELRSPLNSVIGFSRILQKKLPLAPGSGEATYLDRIHANGIHLLGLINNLLDISRIEAGKLDVLRVPVDVAELVRSSVQQLEGQLENPALLLRVEAPAEPVRLETDPQKLRQVLLNLVGNAIKFTPEGEVVVRLRVDAAGLPLAIEVSDTGIGIPRDRLQAIFEPFEQGESGTTRRYGGTGLGLSISKQLCALLGFPITVASDLGRGSTFVVSLRAAAAEP